MARPASWTRLAVAGSVGVGLLLILGHVSRFEDHAALEGRLISNGPSQAPAQSPMVGLRGPNAHANAAGQSGSKVVGPVLSSGSPMVVRVAITAERASRLRPGQPVTLIIGSGAQATVSRVAGVIANFEIGACDRPSCPSASQTIGVPIAITSGISRDEVDGLGHAAGARVRVLTKAGPTTLTNWLLKQAGAAANGLRVK